MKLIVTLSNVGGELDRHEIETDADDDSAEISDQIYDAIDGWVLSPGDTIKIIESKP